LTETKFNPAGAAFQRTISHHKTVYRFPMTGIPRMNAQRVSVVPFPAGLVAAMMGVDRFWLPLAA
jgi:hypothetical protein